MVISNFFISLCLIIIIENYKGNMDYDNLSTHGGCPPMDDQGKFCLFIINNNSFYSKNEVKWGANSFSWNIDSGIGYGQWGNM